MLEKYKPKKILHIGGHIAEEGDFYKSIDAEVLYVEPVPEYADKIRSKGFKVLNVAIGNKRGEVDFRVAGLFSSTKDRISKQDYEDKWLADNNIVVSHITVPMIKLEDIDGEFDTLVVDTEGTVLDVLMSGDLNFKTIMAEESSDLEPQYEDEPHNSEIEKYLNTKGFIKREKFQNNAIYTK